MQATGLLHVNLSEMYKPNCLDSSENPNFSWKKNSLWLTKGHHRQKQKTEYSKPKSLVPESLTRVV